MPFSQSPEETVDVIRLHGDLNQAEMNDLLMVLTGCLVEGRHKVVLNFRDVTHISIDGVSRLAERQQIYEALRGEIKLVGIVPYIANLFKLVGAYSHFDVASNEEEAMARFGN